MASIEEEDVPIDGLRELAGFFFRLFVPGATANNARWAKIRDGWNQHCIFDSAEGGGGPDLLYHYLPSHHGHHYIHAAKEGCWLLFAMASSRFIFHLHPRFPPAPFTVLGASEVLGGCRRARSHISHYNAVSRPSPSMHDVRLACMKMQARRKQGCHRDSISVSPFSFFPIAPSNPSGQGTYAPNMGNYGRLGLRLGLVGTCRYRDRW